MPLFDKIWPLVLATAISPTMLVFATLVLTTKHGRARLLSYIGGWTLAVAALGVFAALGAAKAGQRSPNITGVIDVVLGIVLLGMTAATVLSSRREKRHPKPAKAKKPHADSPRLAPFFAMGIAGLIVDISSVIPFMAAAKDVGLSDLDAAMKAIAAFALWFFITLPLILPLAITVVMPERSKRILDTMSAWLTKHGVAIGVAVMLVVSAYLLIRGGLLLHWF